MRYVDIPNGLRRGPIGGDQLIQMAISRPPKRWAEGSHLSQFAVHFSYWFKCFFLFFYIMCFNNTFWYQLKIIKECALVCHSMRVCVRCTLIYFEAAKPSNFQAGGRIDRNSPAFSGPLHGRPKFSRPQKGHRTARSHPLVMKLPRTRCQESYSHKSHAMTRKIQHFYVKYCQNVWEDVHTFAFSWRSCTARLSGLRQTWHRRRANDWSDSMGIAFGIC